VKKYSVIFFTNESSNKDLENELKDTGALID
jgi:hypothetical protein